MKIATISLFLVSAGWAQTPPACPMMTNSSSQPAIQWDNSGDTELKGTYNFRHVTYSVGDLQGDLNHATALWGTITFTPAIGQANGTYTISGTCLDSNSVPIVPGNKITITGIYGIGSSGWGFLSNPLSPTDVIWGLVSSKSMFLGSSTETQNAFNDLLIAAPAPSSLTNSNLKGSYSVAYMNFPDGLTTDVVTAGFQMEPNGNGGIGPVNIQMYTGSNGNAVDLVESADYNLANGAGTLSFPTLAYPIGGQKTLFTTDGTFIFGGGSNTFDFFAGVATQAQGTIGVSPGFGASAFSGLFYQAGIDEIMSGAAGAGLVGSLQTYYGSFEAVSGTILDHQRILAPLGSPLQGPLNPPPVPGCANSPSSFFCPYQPFNYDFVDTYALGFGSNIGYTDTSTGREYVFSSDGRVRLGFGVYPQLGLSIALKAPASVPTLSSGASGSPYVYPTGVVNSASFAPFTSGIAPGELITIFGANFQNGSQVTFSPVAAPPNTTSTGTNSTTASNPLQGTVIAAYPQQLSVVVPADLPLGFVQIQVVGTGPDPASSMPVWEFVNQTAVGVVTQASDGLGPASATHPNGNPVTPANPAMTGETISVYVVGIENVSQPFNGVSIPGATPVAVTVGGISAVSGVSSTALNAYVSTIQVTVPKGVSGLAVPLVVATTGSTAAQSTIAVAAASGGGSGSSPGGTSGGTTITTTTTP